MDGRQADRPPTTRFAGRGPGDRRGDRHPLASSVLTFALLVVGWAVLSWPWLSGAVTVPWDAKAHFLPQIQFLAESLHRGESPFWAPFVFGGHAQVADPQSMIFSPPFLVLAILNGAPSLWAVDVTVLGAILVAGIAIVLWFRDRGWHWAGGLIAAVCFGFGASMAWRIQHVGQVLSLAYFPIVLLLLDRALRRRSIVYGLLAGLAGAFIVLGRDQVALLVVYLLAAYVLTYWFSAKADGEAVSGRIARTMPALVGGGLVGLAAIVLPIFLTAMLAADSNRPSIDLEGAGRGSLHPVLLLTSIVPDIFGASARMEDYWGPPSFAWNDTGLFIAQNMGQLYIGTAPLLLVLLAGLRGTLWAREIRFFTIALGVTTLYALGWYTPVLRLAYAILPGINLFRRPADATFLMGGLAALLAGYAVHRLFEPGAARESRSCMLVAAAAIGAGFICLVVLALRFERLGTAVGPLLISGASFALAAVVLAWTRSRLVIQPALAAAGLFAFVVADLAWHNGPNTSTSMPPAHYDVLEPNSRNETISILKQLTAAERSETRRDRVELLGLGFHWPNASLTHRLENTLGYNPVRSLLYSRATGAEDHVGLPEQRKFTPLFPSYRSRLSDMLGLRYVAASKPIGEADKTLRSSDMQLVARTADGWIYENPGALPRVLFAVEARQANFEDLLATGQWPDFDPARTVLLSETDGSTMNRRPGKVRIEAYRNTEIVIDADSPDGGFVVLNDLWHPWWFAEIDGGVVEMLRANVLFRAVAVPPGRHRVRFVFQPIKGALRQWRCPIGVCPP